MVMPRSQENDEHNAFMAYRGRRRPQGHRGGGLYVVHVSTRMVGYSSAHWGEEECQTTQAKRYITNHTHTAQDDKQPGRLGEGCIERIAGLALRHLGVCNKRWS